MNLATPAQHIPRSGGQRRLNAAQAKWLNGVLPPGKEAIPLPGSAAYIPGVAFGPGFTRDARWFQCCARHLRHRALRRVILKHHTIQ